MRLGLITLAVLVPLTASAGGVAFRVQLTRERVAPAGGLSRGQATPPLVRPLARPQTQRHQVTRVLAATASSQNPAVRQVRQRILDRLRAGATLSSVRADVVTLRLLSGTRTARPPRLGRPLSRPQLVRKLTILRRAEGPQLQVFGRERVRNPLGVLWSRSLSQQAQLALN